jgi:formylglycine-generating enzyme required for sulfatase activity
MRYLRIATVIGATGGLLALMIAAHCSKWATAKAETNQQAAPSNCQDADRDGYGIDCPKGPDCNDRDPSISPAQKEICNLRDDDCDGLVDNDVSCPNVAYDPTSVPVTAGRLWMGSPANQGANDEHPEHQVEVSSFRIDRYEVTNERYSACVKAGVCRAPQLASSARRQLYFGAPEFSHYPVVFVNWTDANRFCQWDGGRLPTEAEWEMAARGPAPSKRTFPWGDEAPDCTKANMGGPNGCVGDTDLVGRRQWGASPWGVLDMAGNVWEWTADWYDSAYYQRSPKRDPQGPAKGTLKVMRGGCWMSGADSLRVSCRKAELPDTWAPNVGFRCVRNQAR